MTLLHIYTYVNVQQTPNPAAQFPSIEPPFDEHSEAVKHVPYIVLSDLAVHWLWGKSKSFSGVIFFIFTLSHPYLFGKVTTLNNENISEKKSNVISTD